MPDISANPPMKPSEVAGVQPNVNPANMQQSLALDPSSTLISNAETATSSMANQPGAAPVGDLKAVVSDVLLDDRLTKAGLTVSDPAAREKLRESLYTGLQFTALPITDPRFIEHAKHMEMDVPGIQGQLNGIGQEAVGLQQKGEEAVARLQKNNEKGRRAAMGALTTGLISTVVGTVWPYMSKAYQNKFPKTGSRVLASLGTGLVSGFVVGGIVTHFSTGNVVKEQGTILKEGEALQTQFEGVNQKAMALDNSVKEEFLNVHLQRAYTTLLETQGKEGQEQLKHQSGTSHAAQEEIRPYTPVANAENAHAANEIKAYTPVASAESQSAAATTEPNTAGTPQTAEVKSMPSADPTASAPAAPIPQNADGSHSAVPYTSYAVDPGLPKGAGGIFGDTYKTPGTGWATYNREGASPSAESSQSIVNDPRANENNQLLQRPVQPGQGSQSDVGAGGEAPKTSMDAFVNSPPSMEPKDLATQQKETSAKYSADVSGATGGSIASAEDTQAAGMGKYTSMVGQKADTQARSANGFSEAAAHEKTNAGSMSVA